MTHTHTHTPARTMLCSRGIPETCLSVFSSKLLKLSILSVLSHQGHGFFPPRESKANDLFHEYRCCSSNQLDFSEKGGNTPQWTALRSPSSEVLSGHQARVRPLRTGRVGCGSHRGEVSGNMSRPRAGCPSRSERSTVFLLSDG